MSRPDKRTRQHLREARLKNSRLVHTNLGEAKPEIPSVRVSSDINRLKSYFAQTGYAGRSCRVMSNIKGSEPRHKPQASAPARYETGLVGKQLTRKLHREVIGKFRFKP